MNIFFRQQVILTSLLSAEYFVLENHLGYAQRQDGVNADVDINFAELLCQNSECYCGFEDVFPDVMKNIVIREGKNPFPKDDPVGLRTVVLMAMLCGMNILDVQGNESIELIPFLERAKKDIVWIPGFHGLGALLFSIQNNPVSGNWLSTVN